MRLLVAGEHTVFAQSLALVLADAGHDVVAVTGSAPETLDVLAAAEVHLAVLDVGASPALLDRLPEFRSAFPAVAVVLLFAHADGDVAERGRAAGVHGYAYKDGHVADIIDTIARVHIGETVDARAVRPSATVERRGIGDRLTPRERQVLCGLVRGEDTRSIARRMGVTRATARSHIQNMLTKLGVHSRVEAVAAAVRNGLVSAETGEWAAGG